MGKFIQLCKETMEQSSNLKAFFWDDVLEDYNPGFVVVFAHNEEEAWSVLQDENPTAWWVLRGKPEDGDDNRRCHELQHHLRPKMINRPQAFVCQGSA